MINYTSNDIFEIVKQTKKQTISAIQFLFGVVKWRQVNGKTDHVAYR